MKHLFDKVSEKTSKITTRAYSTSFSLGILCVNKRIRAAIYNIYGFVRFADEIVDTFHDYDKEVLLQEFKEDTYKAIDRGISLNPILNSFQHTVNEYKIERELIGCFLKSMETDLAKVDYDSEAYKEYILGSAEVVGLMCLRVFTEGDKALYEKTKGAAMKLGSAFQKVNFLRDMKEDYQILGRTYFPNVDLNHFTLADKIAIERDIEEEFKEALKGIKLLPDSSRFGVYVACVYYMRLFAKIKSLRTEDVLTSRIRIPNYRKLSLLCTTYLKHSLRLI